MSCASCGAPSARQRLDHGVRSERLCSTCQDLFWQADGIATVVVLSAVHGHAAEIELPCSLCGDPTPMQSPACVNCSGRPWRTAIQCEPCRGSGGDQHADRQCPACQGHGWIEAPYSYERQRFVPTYESPFRRVA